jgi:hypothetical protein
MRSAAISLLGCFALSASAAELQITAPISASDVREIRKIVTSVTKAPIVAIEGDRTKQHIRGAFPRNVYVSSDGRRITTYERADIVWAQTALTPQAVMMYKLRKLPRGWKIIEKRIAEDRP